MPLLLSLLLFQVRAVVVASTVVGIASAAHVAVTLSVAAVTLGTVAVTLSATAVAAAVGLLLVQHYFPRNNKSYEKQTKLRKVQRS